MSKSSENTIVQEKTSINAKSEEATKIYCANCIHCKLVPTEAEKAGQFYLRVRCDAGKWKKKLGGEKLYKYFTVTRRSIESCDTYEEMGEPNEYIRELKKTLPIRDEIYEKDLQK